MTTPQLAATIAQAAALLERGEPGAALALLAAELEELAAEDASEPPTWPDYAHDDCPF